MDKKREFKRSLKVHQGIPQPPSINPDVLLKSGRKRRKKYSADEFVSGILAGNRTILSQAITLVESSLPAHHETAQYIIEKCLPFSSKSIRIGITGVPGVGKSTFIETFGLYITREGRKLAVLTVDPSSELTKGSILGDKTRMEQLSIHPGAFIRPSPAAGTLGGVARKTRETIIICEAAGFDTILVETVGVGQSETTVHSMVDFFLLLILTGAGDELQGIKRGIVEIADLIAITKADGANKLVAENTRISYQNALHLFPKKSSGWEPKVRACSALTNAGIKELWEIIMSYFAFTKKSGYFETFRREQEVIRMHNTVFEYLKNSFYNHDGVKSLIPEIERQLHIGTITSYKAALNLLDKYFKRRIE
ncbi:MAG: methylmalonyl Co-A mutase-associated GTPase MeaB [Bacteroidales bacterium]|jgi:LAO/AO transport system kinase